VGDAASTAQAAIEMAGDYRQATGGFRAEDRHYLAATSAAKAETGLPTGRAFGGSLIAQSSGKSAEGKSINTGGRGCLPRVAPFFKEESQ
jgi:hypothetical protein